MMADGIFLIQDDGKLVEMTEAKYDSEDVLQGLLASYPALLVGGQIDSKTPRRWLLISREIGIASDESSGDRWSVDHLFFDQDAIPTLVEVKRSSDTRIRREVVGQMLDYAANAVVYWPIETLRSKFESDCEDRDADPEQVITEFLGDEQLPDDFWQNAKTNLQAGRIRMVFVADEIPNELRRIVEFLNEQMDPAEVLAVEIKQYLGKDNLRTLVPRLVGQTAEAQKRKSASPRRTRQWDEQSFFQELGRERGQAELEIAKKIYAWSKENMSRIMWGSGAKYGSFCPALDHKLKKGYAFFWLYTSGEFTLRFGTLHDMPPFDTEDKRWELAERFNRIPNVNLSKDVIDRYPSMRLSDLQNEASLQVFFEVLRWGIDEVMAT